MTQTAAEKCRAVNARQKQVEREKQEERFSVSFAVSLTWEERPGSVRRINGRCVDLSAEGIRVESRERVAAGTVVLVSSNEFGRMGLATVRYARRDTMLCQIGLRFGAAFGLGDPARRKILERVLSPENPHAVEPTAAGTTAVGIDAGGINAAGTPVAGITAAGITAGGTTADE